MCGGAIISPRFIITAAHCFLTPNAITEKSCLGKKVSNKACYHPPEVFQVGVLSPNGLRQAIQVVKIIAHPQFSVDGRVHDIGLMKLNKPIKCGTMSSPICLPQKNKNKYGRNLIVAGWGRYSDKPAEKKMLEGKMTQVKNGQCLARGESSSKGRRYLCAVATKTNQKSCFGDSGSAIFSKFGDKYFALGVTSFGLSRPNVLCSLDKPAVFTKTYPYLKWIRKYVKDIPRA
ncbi:Transmembrane protease serine 5 [Araneus ventricosus]|uniref:Transmembrane protease serine 5 n=2 Tax=Araneus ventricosus TaxID=182803 RepID=A0A4Y2U4X1_ARAVE|nr:Transmembrane protease serine 5 [Araneus ventricosus]GBO07868.1 Transmembrane protease serine 5 [Araneus ventricosus]